MFLGLTISLGLFGIGVASFALSTKISKAVAADDVTIYSKTVYCRVASSVQTPENMYAYAYNFALPANTTGWTSHQMTVTNSSTAACDGYTEYETSLPINFSNGGVSTNFDRIIFHNGLSNNDEDKTWDLAYSPLEQNAPDDTLMAYVISSTTAQTDNSGINYLGAFTRVSSPVLTSSYMRLWLNRQTYYEDGYLWALHYYGGTADVEVAPQHANMQSTRTGGNYWLAYYDVKTSEVMGKTLQFKAYKTDWGGFEVSTSNTDAYASGNNSQIYLSTKPVRLVPMPTITLAALLAAEADPSMRHP